MRYFFHYELPKLAGWLPVVESRDPTCAELPEEALSTEDWLKKFTKNATVHRLFRNFCAAIWAANADELPARAFLTYFAFKGAFKRFGFCPRGTIGLWNDLGAGIRAKGGEIWLDGKPLHLVDPA